MRQPSDCEHVVHSCIYILVKYVLANVSSNVLNAELWGKIVLYSIVSHSSITCLQNGTKVVLKTITMIDG